MKKNTPAAISSIHAALSNALKRPRRRDEVLVRLLLFTAASMAVIISAAIIYTLLEGSYAFFTNPLVNGVEFLTGTKWTPNGANPNFGILPLVSGTALIAGGSLLIAAPLGVGAALYLSEVASKRIQDVAKPVIEILAGIPSIVYGFFALLTISPILQEYFGASYFNAGSAIIVMAIMVLPIIVSMSDDAMRAVPRHLREASLAMGATRWETSMKVVMPAASSGIVASFLLGLGRALGETMIVTLAAGSVARLTLNPLEETQTMTSYIAQVATGDIPPGVGVDAAFAVGLVLFLITYIVNVIAGIVVRRIKAEEKKDTTLMSRIAARARINVAIEALSDARASVSSRLPKRKDVAAQLRSRYRTERIGRGAVALCLAIAVVFLIILLTSIFSQGLPKITPEFLTGIPSQFKPETAGIYPVIIGSLYLMGLTMLFAVPVGIGAAVYLNEFAHDTRYTRFLRQIIQNLAGVPSIVFGLVGLAIFVRTLGFGTSLLAGSLTLAIMILPIIIVATEEALKSVPVGFREAAIGIGATRWQTVRDHVIPNALPGTLTGVVLALSRAIGETAPILFIGSIFAKTPPGGIMDGFLALPLVIFNWTMHAKTVFHDLAAGTIVVLLVILLSMNTFAIVLRQWTQSRREW